MWIAQLDAANIKPLTKAEMVAFYNEFLSPSSSSRARMSVHLHARGAGELDLKVIELLRSSGLEDVPQEKRQSLELLDGYLEDKPDVAQSKRESIVSHAKELGLSQTAETADKYSTQDAPSAVETAQEITDVRQHKAGLMASQGARPVKELSEFEETDAKL